MTDATTQTGLPFNDVVPGAVLESTKNGLVVAAERLLELARYLRDQEGYDYLSMVTSVDWPQYFEVVYYLFGVAAAEGSAGPPSTSARQGQPGRPVADFRLARRRPAGARGLRHDGHPLRRATPTCGASCSGTVSRATRCARTTRNHTSKRISSPSRAATLMGSTSGPKIACRGKTTSPIRSPGTPTCSRSRRCSTGASWRWISG